ncbi:MAG: hypothetical protein ABWZ77_02010 [Naasia sp.]
MSTGRPPTDQATLDERTRALKERIYASFTGLAVVTVLATNNEGTSPSNAFFTLAASILGISVAGFVAEVLSHQISHEGLPSARETRTMLRIAAGALGSASIPLIVLALSWAGWIELELALQIGVGIYLAVLATITLVASRRTRLPFRQQLLSLLFLVGLGVVVVGILAVAHGH